MITLGDHIDAIIISDYNPPGRGRGQGGQGQGPGQGHPMPGKDGDPQQPQGKPQAGPGAPAQTGQASPAMQGVFVIDYSSSHCSSPIFPSSSTLSPSSLSSFSFSFCSCVFVVDYFSSYCSSPTFSSSSTPSPSSSSSFSFSSLFFSPHLVLFPSYSSSSFILFLWFEIRKQERMTIANMCRCCIVFYIKFLKTVKPSNND